jgi:hypothetical protein
VTAKRVKSSLPRRAPVGPSESPDTVEGDFEPRWVVPLGLAWLVVFCLFFYSFDLPNNSEWSRFLIWFKLPALLPIGELFTTRWLNLAQRADLFGIAVFVWAGAWGLGSLALRILRPPIARGSAEFLVFAMGLGLSAASLITLGFGLAGVLNRWPFVIVFLASLCAELALRFRESKAASPPASTAARSGKQGAVNSDATQTDSRRLSWRIAVAAMVPFLIVMWLGSMSPETDFDVRAYHFVGPKEFFLQGRITRLPHNVYTSFPFHNEMLVLLGMVLHSDWYWGALAGKCVLFAYAPLTALGLYAAGRRWFSPGAGLFAALIYLSSPWIDRLTTIAYVESALLFYLLASLLGLMLVIERLKQGEPTQRLVVLVGLLAGSGMACKYTGALQIVAPIGAAIALASWFTAGLGRSRLQAVTTTALAFALGVTVTIGPWLLKNLAETRNPVFPLGYSLFGGTDWSPALNEKFMAGHTTHNPRSFFQCLGDVTANNDWSSPLWYGLAPLALFLRPKRLMVFGLWAFAGYLFLTWFSLTHQIDRFWTPMIPVLCLLAGIGAEWRNDVVWRFGRNVVVALALLFNLAFIAGTETAYLQGYNAFLGDLDRARDNREQSYMRYLNQLNEQTPGGIKVLCVGDAEVFEARFPVVYNAVFNESIFERWFAAEAKPGTPATQWQLRPPAEISTKLHDEGITHIYVNWSWIRTYRSPGNYGYSKFVTAARFEQLRSAGVLGEPTNWGAISVHGLSLEKAKQLVDRLPFGQQMADGRTVAVMDWFDTLTAQELDTLKEVGPSLLGKNSNADGQDLLINAQLFPVRKPR